MQPALAPWPASRIHNLGHTASPWLEPVTRALSEGTRNGWVDGGDQEATRPQYSCPDICLLSLQSAAVPGATRCSGRELVKHTISPSMKPPVTTDARLVRRIIARTSLHRAVDARSQRVICSQERNRERIDPTSAHGDAPGAKRLGMSGKLVRLHQKSTRDDMLAEVVFYVPSIANFRINWLTDRHYRRRAYRQIRWCSAEGRCDRGMEDPRRSLAREAARQHRRPRSGDAVSAGMHRVLVRHHRMPTQEIRQKRPDTPQHRRRHWAISIFGAFDTLNQRAATIPTIIRVVGTAPDGSGDFRSKS